ncbi:MAG: hypothetical protein A2275_14190 [Bacteroidetes bacterium RIFOXYA12_FULL_35_11]|nr:MAG: hypothetical protein A2X01_15945 [Bacteroidetes bacterium GWF2_35_48]OFY83515.1 MAG: hypothetical protein A2275_14190 [Bacteroidetes bacterium RIFOXYA12_FULL_35_11]OFY93806.1 MAG: hypothetical protein A2309_14925 [Bacteroidetes bacterium RIFOXYB2_FULL_35_7]OFY94776.1 MAG: hypothetical protein A2491_01465 [Bacteroidetes bacterium RIFOXYC12_FULL_35_7]HBX50821.1 hypothetical protein [Bacteroidales bacterium]
MKKIYTLILSVIAFSAFSQNNEWRMGIQVGGHGSHIQLTGGMPEANARFDCNNFGAGQIDISGRYDLNDKFMFQSGLGFTETGFQFTILENYSLIGKIGQRKNTTLRYQLPVVQIPFMAAYKTPLNCRNIRYFIGCGVVLNFQSDSVNITNNGKGDAFSVADTSYLGGSALFSSQTSIDPRFTAGIEKAFKKGGMLSFSFVAHLHTGNPMRSTAHYTIDGTRYYHEFKSTGSYCGFMISYWFRNFGWKNKQVETELIKLK